jgi:flagellar biosynthesis protein FlhG
MELPMVVRDPRGAARREPRAVLNPVRVIGITGGKGGVGKTTIAINMATAMAQMGRRVLLLDGDLGLANVDVLLGIAPRLNLGHVISGERPLEDIIVEVPQGFGIIPAASGVERLVTLSDAEHAGLVRAFSSLGRGVDTLIVDTAAGISPAVLQLLRACQHVVLAVCDEPASVTDAYAMVKVLSRSHGVNRFHIVASMVRERGAGENIFRTLTRVAGRFLDVTLEFAGEIPDDPLLRRAIREQRPVVDAYPSSPSAMALKQLSVAADNWPVPGGARGHIEFFAERLVQRRPARLEVVR